MCLGLGLVGIRFASGLIHVCVCFLSFPSWHVLLFCEADRPQHLHHPLWPYFSLLCCESHHQVHGLNAFLWCLCLVGIQAVYPALGLLFMCMCVPVVVVHVTSCTESGLFSCTYQYA